MVNSKFRTAAAVLRGRPATAGADELEDAEEKSGVTEARITFSLAPTAVHEKLLISIFISGVGRPVPLQIGTVTTFADAGYTEVIPIGNDGRCSFPPAPSAGQRSAPTPARRRLTERVCRLHSCQVFRRTMVFIQKETC